MSDENFNQFVPNVHFELIPIKNLVSNQPYQRPISNTHVGKTASHFDLYQINPVKVSRRDGINYVFDGQHTIETVATASKSRETPVWCMIYDDLEYEQEADIFANQKRYTRPLKSIEIFNANIEAENEVQVAIKQIVEGYNLTISPRRIPGHVQAVSALEYIFNKYGYHVLDRTIFLAVSTWEGEVDSMCSNMLKGIAKLVVAYGEQLKDDQFMSDRELHFTIHHFLLESDICYKSYLALRKLLDSACECQSDNEQVIIQIKELSLAVIGRDIFKKEIGIVDGHDSSSYFWIMPVRVLDLSNTDAIDSVAEMRSIEISIEEDDVDQYLTPFLYKYFDGELEANKKRTEYCWTDDDGTEHAKYITGFEWYLTHNFYTFDAVKNIINDIRDTADALASGRANEFTAELRKKRGFATYELVCAKNLSEEQINAYNASRPQEDDTKIDLIVDFYRRFIYRMEYMIKVGQEKGYNLISFMGP